MVDALVRGLESCLTDLEESISETDNLISSKKNEAVRGRNEIRVDLAWNLFKRVFRRGPTSAELSKLTGLSEKTVDNIVKSERFNLYIKSVEKSTRSKNYKKVETVEGIPLLFKKRRGYSEFHKKEGRPHIIYVEKHNGLPRALAFWNDLFSPIAEQVRNNRHIQEKIEALNQKLDAENKRELGLVNRKAMNETYLPQVSGAVAHRLFEICTLPSSGRVYSYIHKMFNDMVDKLVDIIKKYLEKLNNPKGFKYLQEARLEAKKSSAYLKKIAKFSEFARKKENHVVALAFQKWMDCYGGKSQMRNIEQMLFEATEDEHLVSDLVESIFNLINKQAQNIISSLTVTEYNKNAGESLRQDTLFTII